MSQAMYAAVSGASNNQMRLNILTNNLANVNTVGFKKDKLYFHIPEAKGDSPATQGIKGFQISPPAEPYETRTDFSPSPLRHTNNALDLALDGEGFFCVQTPEGKCYTRRGNFSLTQEGKLITREGFPVLGKAGEIIINGKDITVDDDGQITADGDLVDTIKVVSIGNPHMLKKASSTLFVPQDGQVDERKTESVKIKQGFLESSNVNGVRTMTEMIEVMRGYEAYQKIIKFLSDAAKKSINEVGRLA